MQHKYEDKMTCNELSMCWVEYKKCIYCGVKKKEAGENESCPVYSKLCGAKGSNDD